MYFQGGTNNLVQFGLLRTGDLRLFLILQKIQCYSTSLERFFFGGDLKLVKGTQRQSPNSKTVGLQACLQKKQPSSTMWKWKCPSSFLPGCVSVDGQKPPLRGRVKEGSSGVCFFSGVEQIFSDCSFAFWVPRSFHDLQWTMEPMTFF